ncbi:MAG: FprA family A-type flavoprotein [Tissierellia bacterium]|nr:FprA family A-type flavoprotein [Tissierellia bacterium]
MSNILSVPITDKLTYIGVNDRTTQLFENMWPLENGVSYNSYLITDEKTALLDTVKVNRMDVFLEKLDEALEGRNLDYLVIQHMEPDHSGAIETVMELYPNVKLVGNKKTREFLKNYYDIEEESFIEVVEGDKLELGETNLTFYMTPMVHWPESMVSFDEKNGILYSQDIFGSFGALGGPIFDDEINWDLYLPETIRYYTNIVGKYSKQVQIAMKKLGALDIKMVCAVHGPIWRDNPGRIIDLYAKLANYETEEGVVVVYGSMYGNTEKMAETIARSLSANGIKNIKLYDVSKTHLSYLLSDLWRYDGIVLGSCTYNNGVFPLMQNLLQTLLKQKMSNHTLAVFGSYGWGGGSVRDLMKFAEESKYDLVETTADAKGSATKEDLELCKQIGKEMADILKAKRA